MIIFATSLWVLGLMLQSFSRDVGDRGLQFLVSMCRCLPREVTLMFSFSSGVGSGWCYIYGFPCHIPLSSPVLPAAAWQGPLSSQRDSRHTKSCVFSDSDCSGKGCHLSVNLGAEAGTGEAKVTGSGAGHKTMTPSSVWAFSASLLAETMYEFDICWIPQEAHAWL